MIKQINDIMHPTFILPFANFNSLYLPEHEKYLKSQPKNTPHDVATMFEKDDVKILELLPGEKWDGKTNSFITNSNRESFYANNYMLNYLSDSKIHNENEKFIPKNFDLKLIDIQKYFEEFGNSKIVEDIGEYVIRLIAEQEHKKIDCLIEFNQGRVNCSKYEDGKKFHMKMWCPGGIVQHIIENDLSWDEVQSGYWANYDRNPDTYNIALWKLFHAPWQARPNYRNNYGNQSIGILDKKSAIADIIENGDKRIIETLEKFGLYCAGCEASVGETIEDGCSVHGLTDTQTSELIKELKSLQKKE
jgi:CMP-N-acetylneuraminate monooxygenase